MAEKIEGNDEEFGRWWENHVNRHVRHCRVVNVKPKVRIETLNDGSMVFYSLVGTGWSVPLGGRADR